jgi:arylsulfatase A-like enzyme
MLIRAETPSPFSSSAVPETADRYAGLRAWRLALLPSAALLGAALPFAFLTWIEQYLYYLRPAELLPLYASAWLLCAALILPWSFVGGLALLALDRLAVRGRPLLRRGRNTLALGLVVATSVIIAAALTEALVVWLRTFHVVLHANAAPALTLGVVAAGTLLALVPRTRAAILRAAALFAWVAALGGLTLISLPFAGWGHGGPLATHSSAPSAADRPNILLITIDALSASHMSLYGASRPTTPNLEAFARGATTFDEAYANGNFTTPGVASLLTGTRPWTHRALELPSWPRDEERWHSLPAVLHAAGYETGYVSTNAEAGAAKNGLGQYFDFASRDRLPGVPLCGDAYSAVLRYVCPAAQLPLFNAYAKLARVVFATRDNSHFDPRLAIGSALAWLDQRLRTKPIFLWVHLMPPHSPYAAPVPWLGRFDASPAARSELDSDPPWGYLLSTTVPKRVHALEARYDEAILYVDYYIGQLLREAQRPLGRNSIIVITADHGESFHHGYGGHQGPALYEELIHIPLIVKLPGQTQAVRSDVPAEQIDVAPTLTALAGLAAPAIWEGHALLPTLTSERPVFSMDFEQNPRWAPLTIGTVAVREGRWKLIHYMGALSYPQMPDPRDEIYDLQADPQERRNLASQPPAQMQHLRALIAEQLALHGAAPR